MSQPQSLAMDAPSRRVRNAIRLDEIENTMVRRGVEIWLNHRGGRKMPLRSALGPRAFVGLLANMAVVRVLDGGDEFQFRIIGDQIRLQQAANLQGKTMAEVERMLPGHGEVLGRIYRNACKAAEPLAFRGWYARPADRHPFCHEVVILPVGEDDETADHLFIVAA